MKKKIVASVISDLSTDQRVIRICETLTTMGFEVFVIARYYKNSLPLGTYNFKAIRIRCRYTQGVLLYAEFNLKLFFKLLKIKTDYLLANDLDTLLPNYLVSLIHRKKLFYDTHEYFTGVPELQQSPIKRSIWKLLEDIIFPRLKTVYTVNDSVKNEYQSIYKNVPIRVVRNMPVTVQTNPAEKPKHWEGKTILLAQGAGLNEGRSCIELIDAMNFLGPEYHLVYIGGGTQWEALLQKRAEYNLESRIDMLDRMPPAQLKSYTPLAHLGFSLDTFSAKNCLFNLPNKIFDYVQAGVPVIATEIPEIKKLIEQYEFGICIKETSPVYLAETIRGIISDTELYKQMKRKARMASQDLCWENESKVLIDIYHPYL